jgi:hypothetical protein
MTLKKAIEILEQHHSWRQGFHDKMVSANDLTAAMVLVIQTLKEFISTLVSIMIFLLGLIFVNG